jgi:hypothetical protein
VNRYHCHYPTNSKPILEDVKNSDDLLKLLEFVDHPAETKARENAQDLIQRAIDSGNIE